MQNAQPDTCPLTLFNEVKKFIREFELDDRALQISEFLTLTKNDKLLAFGRIREYESCAEICSVGVIDEARQIGLAKKLVRALSSKTSKPLYLVCIIPSFFEKLGFKLCNDYPEAIRNKVNYCIDSLSVPETYVVMRLQREN